MKRRIPVFCFPCLLALVALSAPQRSFAQSAPPPAVTFDGQQAGWLVGAVTNTQGEFVYASHFQSDHIHIKGTRQAGGEFDVQVDPTMGNSYDVRNLRPGVYEITVAQGYVGYTSYSPIRYFGVVIKPGVRTFLNIVMDQGTTLEERGNPTVPTVDVTIVSEQLASLQKQLDALKAQLAALQAKPPASITAPATPDTKPAAPTSPPAK